MKIQMTGGSPWGFRMTGGHDFRQPLAIGKVTAGSKADRAGVVEGHHILTVNGEDVTQLAHLDAQNKIKAAKTTLVLELSNVPLPKPTVAAAEVPVYQAPKPLYQSNQTNANKGYAAANKPPAAYNSTLAPSHAKSVSLPSTMSTSRSPTSYSSPHAKTSSFEEGKVTQPDIEYRPVDSRDSQRRMYEELQDSEYAPTAHQSTMQSPSMQALARSSNGYAAHSSSLTPDADKKKLQITEEIRDLILEEEDGHGSSPKHDAALRPTGVKVYDPHQKFVNRPSPAPYAAPSSSDFVQPAAPPPTHSPQSSYSSQPQPAKSKAVGNISKFLQSSGAKQGPPAFLKTLQDLQCPYGDPAVLEIRIGNTLPVPTVNWYHNERPVRESREKDIKFLNRGIVHTLVLGEFSPEFAGRYRCVLTNKHGSASCSSILSVEQQGNGQTYSAPPQPVNNTARGYQPSYTSTYQAPTSNYQPQTHRVTKPLVASNSVGLYSQNAAKEAYSSHTKQKTARDSDEDESAVMRALREEGHVNDGHLHHHSRSMRILEETFDARII